MAKQDHKEESFKGEDLEYMNLVIGENELLSTTFDNSTTKLKNMLTYGEFLDALKELLILSDTQNRSKEAFDFYKNDQGGLSLECFISAIHYAHPRYDYLWQQQKRNMPYYPTIEEDLTIQNIGSNLKSNIDWGLKTKSIRSGLSQIAGGKFQENQIGYFWKILVDSSLDNSLQPYVRRCCIIGMSVFASLNQDFVLTELIDKNLFLTILQRVVNYFNNQNKNLSLGEQLVGFSFSHCLTCLIKHVCANPKKSATLWTFLFDKIDYFSNELEANKIKAFIIECLYTLVEKQVATEDFCSNDDAIGNLYEEVEKLNAKVKYDNNDEITGMAQEMLEMFKELEK